VDGTGATANNGTVTAKYSNSTGKLSTTGRQLHVYNVSGWHRSPPATPPSRRLLIVSPKQTITSP
jgi:hypothetical protein